MGVRLLSQPSTASLKHWFSSAIPEFKKPLAFAFDIDGVLTQGKATFQQACDAMALLYEGGKRPRYPICFLTNGGGVTEEQKVEDLTKRLQVPVDSSQVVLSHTPFRELAREYADKPMLISGRHKTAEVARHYGYHHAITTEQLAAAYPHAVPFSLSIEGSQSKQKSAREQLRAIGTEARPFEAVMVYTDPNEWYTDLQLIHDVLASGGVIGKQPDPKLANKVKIFFSNGDLLWANEHPVARFGQGALQVALRALHKQVLDIELTNFEVFGKPHPEPYRLAEALLKRQAASINGSQELGSVVAVGDNPASDIAGARAAGRPWVSILVRTGVYKGKGNSEKCPADFTADGVYEAVQTALRQHKMNYD